MSGKKLKNIDAEATGMLKDLKPEDIKALLKEKLEDAGVHQGPSPAQLKKINALKNVQVKLLEIEAKFYDDLHELECKYVSQYEPYFEKRRQIVCGEYEPTDEEGKWALDELNDSEVSDKIMPKLENGADDPTEKGVENFWLETLQSFRITSEMIQEYDEPILSYLQDIRIKLFDKKPYGYTLEFYFGKNPYFTNEVLTKTYELKTEVDPKDPFSYDGPDLERAVGSKINWNANKNVCVKLIKKKIKSKNKKQPPKIITKEEKQDSFFNFFDTPKVSDKSKSVKSPASSGTEDNKKQVALKTSKKSESEVDEDDDEEHDAELYLIADFEVGQYLKEKIIPKAILYYTGEGIDDEFDEEDYDEDEEDEEGDENEDDDDDEEDEEDDDDDDDDDEDDEDKKKGGKKKLLQIKGKSGAKPTPKAGEPTPSECKQN